MLELEPIATIFESDLKLGIEIGIKDLFGEVAIIFLVDFQFLKSNTCSRNSIFHQNLQKFLLLQEKLFS